MFRWLKSLWRDRDRRAQQALEARSFQRLAREIHDLARAAGILAPGEREFMTRIRRIQTEMDELAQLAERPEFERLSPGKRFQLTRSLLQSRQQLMKTVERAPAPTDRVQ